MIAIIKISYKDNTIPFCLLSELGSLDQSFSIAHFEIVEV